MTGKYEGLDQRILAWLAENKNDATTTNVIAALGITNPTTQRHVSRRFTHLEDRGVITCKLVGTRRVCSVVKLLPENFKKKWKWQGLTPSLPVIERRVSIPANSSAEYEALGGVIERIPVSWDTPAAKTPLGSLTLQDRLTQMD